MNTILSKMPSRWVLNSSSEDRPDSSKKSKEDEVGNDDGGSPDAPLEEEPSAAQALLELGNSSKNKKGKKSKGKKKSKKQQQEEEEGEANEDAEHEELIGPADEEPETIKSTHDDIAAADADVVATQDQHAREYHEGGNVEDAVMHIVGGTLHQESDKKRKAAGYENPDMGFEGLQPWEKFLNDDIVLFPDHQRQQTLMQPLGGGQQQSSQGRQGPRAKRRRPNHATTDATSNVDPALEHLDDSHGTEDFSKNQELVEQAMLHASAIASSLGPGPASQGQHDGHLELVQNQALASHGQLQSSGGAGDLGDLDRKKGSWAGDGSEAGGSFTKEEMQEIENYMLGYMEDHNLNRQQLCERVWSNERKKDNFWDSVANVLSHRTRSSVYKHVRRRYHVFHVRGKWTPEEDAQLGQLVNAKGAQWKAIGVVMGRMPEDCRDRWRNYVKCGEQRNQNKWSPEEENQLKDVVLDMIQRDPSGEVNWTVVSEQMGGTRSRIQCRYKWNKISKRASDVRAESMQITDKIAVMNLLKNYNGEDQINWETVSVIEGKSVWSAKDISNMFYRQKSKLVDSDKMEFHELIDAIVDDLHKSQPRRPRRYRNGNGDEGVVGDVNWDPELGSGDQA